MSYRCEIIDGPDKAKLMKAFSETTEPNPKTVIFTVKNPKPGNGHPDTDTCEIAIYLLGNKGDGEHWIFGGRHGFPHVEGQYNTRSHQGYIDFL